MRGILGTLGLIGLVCALCAPQRAEAQSLTNLGGDTLTYTPGSGWARLDQGTGAGFTPATYVVVTNDVLRITLLTNGHDCCTTGHGPGCSNQTIEGSVCQGYDPNCCELDWTGACVSAVSKYTGGKYFCPSDWSTEDLRVDNGGQVGGDPNVTLGCSGGSSVCYQGKPIGNWTGGNDGRTPLLIYFTKAASPVVVAAVGRSILYRNTTSSPDTSISKIAQFVYDPVQAPPGPADNVFINYIVPPVINTANGFTVNEGANFTIGSGTWDASDGDGPDSQIYWTLRYNYTGTGQLTYNGNARHWVTQSEINSGLVRYEHNGAEVTSDSMTLEVTDQNNCCVVADGTGCSDTQVTQCICNNDPYCCNNHWDQACVNQVPGCNGSCGNSAGTAQIGINITPVNDKPIVQTNTALTVTEGASATVTSARLTATDGDHATTQIFWTVTNAPDDGQFELGGSATGWFTQAQINAGSVTYDHDGTEPIAGVDDSATLVVTDTHNCCVAKAFSITGCSNTTIQNCVCAQDAYCCNTSWDQTCANEVTSLQCGTCGETATGSQTFNINVNPVNDPPELTTNAPATVFEGSSIGITSSNLDVTDPDNGDSQLLYTVQSAPSDGIVRLSGSQTTTFTQANINAGAVSYLHQGAEESQDSFVFSVSDGSGGTIGNTTFTINVTPVNDPPVITANGTLTVSEGQSATFTTSQINGSDPDNTASQLTWTVTSAPSNGTIRVGTTAVSSFTHQQLLSGSVNYLHDDSQTTSDSFSLNLSDGSATTGSQSFGVTINAVNDPPQPVNNNGLTVSEGASGVITGSLLRYSDPDHGNGQIVYTVTDAPNNGTLLVNGMASTTFTQSQLNNNLVSYLHGDGENTSDSFDFSVADTGGASGGSGTFDITVTPVNDPPTLAPGSSLVLQLDEGATATLTAAIAGFIDPDDGAGAITITVGTPSNGSWSQTSFTQSQLAAGSVTFTHDDSENHDTTVSISASDDGGASSGTLTLTLDIAPVNDAPVLVTNSGLTVAEGASGVIDESRLNTIDADDGITDIEYTIDVPPSNGALSLYGSPIGAGATFEQYDVDNGALSYQHDGSQTTSDSFDFTVGDGQLQLPSTTFNISINAVNNDPVVAVNAGLSVAEGGSATLGQSQLEATDVDNPPGDLTWTIVTAPANGAFQLGSGPLGAGGSFTQAQINSGAVTYLHDESETTGDSAVLALSDGVGGSAPNQTIDISVSPVNDAPVASAGTLTIAEGGAATLTAAVLSASDDDNGPASLTFTVTSAPASLTLASSFTQADLAGAGVSVSHDGSEPAAASLEVTLSDGTETVGPFTVDVVVTPTNDGPSLTAPATATAYEDQDAGVPGVSLSDPDVGEGEVSVSLSLSGGGTLSVASSALLTFGQGDGTDDNAMSFSGSLGEVNAALAGLSYRGAANFNGSETLTIDVDDQGNTGAGGPLADTAQVVITVEGVNDAPTFTPGQSQTVLEDAGPQVVTAWATDISAGPPDELEATSFFVVNDNNALFSSQPSIAGNGNLTFTPAPNANGVANVTVELRDLGGTANGGDSDSDPVVFTISVTAVNDPPTFTGGGDQVVFEDAGAVSVPGWATAISAGPADEASQNVTFVTAVNGAALFAVQPSVAPNGTLTFTVADNAVGTALVNVQAVDDGGTAFGGSNASLFAGMTITITEVNDPPTFSPGPTVVALEDAGPQTRPSWATAISVGPTSEDGQSVSFSLSTSSPELFEVMPAIDAGGDLTFTPAADAVGTASVTVVATDDGGTANGGDDTSQSASFDISLTPVNDPPSFTPGGDQTLPENSPPEAVAWATNISPGPADEAGQTVSFAVTNDNPSLFAAEPAIAGDGTLTYTLATDTNGSALVTVVASDDGGTADGGVDTAAPVTFEVNVGPVNQGPSFTAGADQTVAEDAGPQTVADWATDISPGPPDEAGQTVNFVVTTDNDALFAALPAVATVAGASTSALTFTPAPDAFGTAVVTVVARDSGGTAGGGVDTSPPQTFTIEITSVNDPPTFSPGGDVTVAEDAGAQSLVWASGLSPGPANESFQTASFDVTTDNPSLFSAPPSLATDGTLTFTPAADVFGATSVTVFAVDEGPEGGATSPSTTFTITIEAVNDAPTLTLGLPPSVDEDAGPQTLAGWATGIGPGASNESGQALSLTLTTDNDALFSQLPALDLATGDLTFAAAPDANGTATLTLALADDGGTAAGGADTLGPLTFDIEVTPVNDPPSFTGGSNQLVPEDSPPQSVAGWATNISAGPPDEQFQVLTFDVANDNPALFAAAPAVSPEGTLSYALAPNTTGMAAVTVTLIDNGGTLNGGDDTSETYGFTIEVGAVNEQPSYDLLGETAYSVAEDSGPQTIAGWADNMIPGPPNEADQQLTFVLTPDDPSLFAEGPAISVVDGTLTFTPAPDAFGVASVQVILRDDAGTAGGGVDSTDPVTLTLTIDPVNDAPSFTAGADVPIGENAGPQSLAWATDISAGPANEAGQTLSFDVSVDAPGLFAVEPAIGLDGTLTFEPAPDVSGDAEVTVVLTDDGGTLGGGVDSSPPATFTISIASVNNPPTFTAGEDVSALEDAGPQTIAGWATDVVPGPPDEAGQSVTFELTYSQPELFATPPAIAPDGTLTFEPAPDMNGSSTVTVVAVDDGGGTDTSSPQAFTISILPVNDPPSFELAGASQTVPEDSPPESIADWAINISPGPADEADQVVSFVVTTDNDGIFSAPPAIDSAGTLTFAVAPAANGTANVTVTPVDDGGLDNGGVDTGAALGFVISIGAINAPPTFTLVENPDQQVDEDAGPQAVPGFVQAFSPGPGEDFQTVTFVVDSDAEFLFEAPPAIDGTGTLTWTAAPDLFGVATVSVFAMDDGGTAAGGDDTSETQTFTLTIDSVNDAPSYISGGDVQVDQTQGPFSQQWATDVSPGPLNEADQTVSFVVSTDAPTLFDVPPTIDGAGVLSFTPSSAGAGVANVTVAALDDGGNLNGGVSQSVPEVFTITIVGGNDPPTFVGGEDQTVLEDAGPQTVAGWASGISPGPADESDQQVSFTVTNNNPALFEVEPSVAEDGTLSYTPAANANGVASVTVIAVDDGGGVDPPAQSAGFTFAITVVPVNDPPVVIPSDDEVVVPPAQGFVAMDQWFVISPGAGADEADQSVTITIEVDDPSVFVSLPEIDEEGNLTFELEDGFIGLVVVTVTVTDSGGTADGGDDTTVIEFGINASADLGAPTPVVPVDDNGDPLPYETDEDTPLDITLDASGGVGVLTWTIVIEPEHGTLSGTAPDLVYTPDPDFFGSDSFAFTVSSGALTSAPAQLFVDVLPVNDAPIFVDPTPSGTLAATEGTPLTFTVATDDIDSTDVTVTLVDGPGALDGDGYSWTPSWQDGTQTLTLSASDGQDATEHVLTIEVAWLDGDGDGLPDTWEAEEGLDPSSADSDGDGIDDLTEAGGGWQSAGDTDGDGDLDAADLDSDGDGLDDALEAGDDDLSTPPVDTDEDGTPDYLDLDSDGDEVPDAEDNCAVVVNPGQQDFDGDNAGDACDLDDDNDGLDDQTELESGLDPLDPDTDDDTINDGEEYGDGETPLDSDADGVIDALDEDSDADGILDEVEAGDPDLWTGAADTDGDGKPDYRDEDSDNDEVLDDADNCRLVGNRDQNNADGTEGGDACDDDADGDGVTNAPDNCTYIANADQADNDGDAAGDVCDSDDDNDTILDAVDNCPFDPNTDQSDVDGDGDGDVCDTDGNGDGNTGGGCECRAGGAPDGGLVLILAIFALVSLRRRKSLI